MARDRFLVMLLGLHAVSGCAREARPPEVPGMPEARASAEEEEPVQELPRRHVRHGFRSLSIPEGDLCLARLAEARVPFRVLDPTPGMKTPVAVTGPIGGVSYETAAKTPLVCDCRLAVALGWVAPELSALGVTWVRYSGAYVYRTQRSGRPSLHAEGLAIDVHELAANGNRWDVERSFARGGSCASDVPVPNRLACDLGRTGLFEEIITPDDDGDHRDHLHLAIAPL